MKEIRIGTRSSKLALWQTNYIENEIQKQYPNYKVEIIHIKTTGDKILNSPLSQIGGKGLFTKEIETQLLEGKIDLAVHSLKDVPAQLDERFKIAAITKRFEPFDSFVSNKYDSFKELPDNAKVGTSSLRRRAQLLKAKPELQIENLRGNVDTRLKKLDNGEFDAIILATAGLKRLGYETRIKEILPIELMIPAVGQGALAIEILNENVELKDKLQFLNDLETEKATKSERAFLKEVEGDCQVPIGVYAKILNQRLIIKAMILSIDGKKFVEDEEVGEINQSEELGITLAKKLLNKGGKEILKS